MPHEHIELAQTPNGEIGPRCNECGIRLTFGEAMVTANTIFAGNIMSRLLAQIPQQWKFKDRLDSGKSEGSSLSYSSTRLRWYCVRLGKIRTSFYSILPHSRIVDPPKIEDKGMDVHTVRRRDTN